MNRILIVGSPGAGKSTITKELAKRRGIPLYHLDLIWFHDNGHMESREKNSRKYYKLKDGL